MIACRTGATLRQPAMTDPVYHIVFLDDSLLLVRRAGADWRALQDAFPDYKSSLGPWTLQACAEWLTEEYGEDPDRDARIAAFAGAAEDVLGL